MKETTENMRERPRYSTGLWDAYPIQSRGTRGRFRDVDLKLLLEYVGVLSCGSFVVNQTGTLTASHRHALLTKTDLP